MTLAKCPNCNGFPYNPTDTERVSCLEGCGYGTINGRAMWNRLARLVRKGRMFEWLERRQNDGNAPGLVRKHVLAFARDWWRNRKATGEGE